jgi:hypothetical protein
MCWEMHSVLWMLDSHAFIAIPALGHNTPAQGDVGLSGWIGKIATI